MYDMEKNDVYLYLYIYIFMATTIFWQRHSLKNILLSRWGVVQVQVGHPLVIQQFAIETWQFIVDLATTHLLHVWNMFLTFDI